MLTAEEILEQKNPDQLAACRVEAADCISKLGTDYFEWCIFTAYYARGSVWWLRRFLGAHEAGRMKIRDNTLERNSRQTHLEPKSPDGLCHWRGPGQTQTREGGAPL